MPATNGLQPPLEPAERAVVKEYGGWTNYMNTMGLKAHDSNDNQTGKNIVSAFAREDARSSSSSSSSSSSKKK